MSPQTSDLRESPGKGLSARQIRGDICGRTPGCQAEDQVRDCLALRAVRALAEWQPRSTAMRRFTVLHSRGCECPYLAA